MFGEHLDTLGNKVPYVIIKAWLTLQILLLPYRDFSKNGGGLALARFNNIVLLRETRDRSGNRPRDNRRPVPIFNLDLVLLA